MIFLVVGLYFFFASPSPSADVSESVERPDKPRAAYAFAAAGGARSIDAHRSQIDVVVADGFHLPDDGCEVLETVDDAGRRWTARSDMRVVARVSGRLPEAPARSCVVARLATRAGEIGARGVNVDLEGLAADDAPELVAFLSELRAAMGPDARLSIAVAPDDPAYDLERLGGIADDVILMAHGEHRGSPGPLASAAWFADVVDRARAQVPADRLVVGIGSYCHDWQPRSDRAETLSFGAAMARAGDAQPTFDATSGGTRFRYADHEVWCSDALSVHNQRTALAARGITRWALWRAGSEDPSLWSASGASLASSPERDVVRAQDGSVRSAVYRVAPRPFVGALTLGDRVE